MPQGRTNKYATWRACELFQLVPPNVKKKWDDNDVLTQADLIAYYQIRDYEDQERAVIGLR